MDNKHPCTGEDCEDCRKVQEAMQKGFIGQLPVISRENEIRAWRHIEMIVNERLAKYPTSLHDDNVLLERDMKYFNLGLNERNCI